MSISAQRKADVLVPAACQTGEGAVWDKTTNSLLWVDILAGRVFRTTATGDTTRVAALDGRVGCVLPDGKAGFVAARETSLVHVRASRQTSVLGHVRRTDGPVRFNDGAVDPVGRVFVGLIGGVPNTSEVYRFDSATSRPLLVVTGLSCANGIGWSPDGRWMYLADTGPGLIYRYPYETETGSLGAPDVWAELPAGQPDGLVVDAEGGVWIALIGGGRVIRMIDGHVRETVLVPCPKPTSVALGGPTASTLFITSARRGLDADTLARHPASGSLFAIEAGVPGLAPPSVRLTQRLQTGHR